MAKDDRWAVRNICLLLFLLFQMDVCMIHLHMAVWALMDLHAAALSFDVKVMSSQLMLCEEDRRVCVTDPRDCRKAAAPPPHQILNMSCYYQRSEDTGDSSMRCVWSSESDGHSDASLTFTSQKPVLSCQGVFSPVARLNVTARMRSHTSGTDSWSQPHPVSLGQAFLPLQPVLRLLNTTADSLLLSWSSSVGGSCRLRCSPASSLTWTPTKDSIRVDKGKTVTSALRPLQPSRAYRASVSCRGPYGLWSHWSADVSGTTLDRAPSRPPEVCYSVEETDLRGPRVLRLIWKPLDHLEAGGRLLGYRLTSGPSGGIQNVTGTTALVNVMDDHWSISVEAFNTAGWGPAARLTINTHSTLPAVRQLWISSLYPAERALRVQWKSPANPVPPSSLYVVQWHSETNPSVSGWSEVHISITSWLIQDVDPEDVVLVSVFLFYKQLCGSAQFLPASLQHGALVEPANLKVVGGAKTTVTVSWVWRRKVEPTRVNQYRLMLKRDSERQTQMLWLDQQQHVFSHLKPDTEYFLHLLADNVSTDKKQVKTHFDRTETDAVRVVVSSVTPVLLLAFILLTILILYRTVYKPYCFPPVCSPRESTAGRWLMEPNLQKHAERIILDMKAFQEDDVLRGKSVIVVGMDAEQEPLHDAAAALLQYGQEADSWAPQDENEDTNSPPTKDEESLSGLMCEDPAVSLFLMIDAEGGQKDGSYLICEADYVSNTHFC